MRIVGGWNWARTWARDRRAQLRLCLRVTVAAVLAYALSYPLAVPLRGLWAVLTAVVVTQISVGGSLRATTEYVIGTVGGAIYASAVGLLIPHSTPVALAGVLALTIAPLALLAAVSTRFRAAPFTGVIVLMVSTQFAESLIESAFYRLLEVALGGVSAILVSLLVLPERAHSLGLEAAARVLDRLAHGLPALLAGFTRKLDAGAIARIQEDIGGSVTRFQTIVAEAMRERFTYLAAEPDPGPLSRTLLRLRHDLVIVGRAAVAPLPDAFVTRLGPWLAQVGESACDYLRASAGALVSRRSPPPFDTVHAAFEGYAAEIAALRSEGLTRALPNEAVERIFTLGFALEQLHRNFLDLERCVKESARFPS
jgi:uncharacterized membrane protein YccC